jgi:DNA-binding MarR family transcriptional regulator
MMRPIEPPPAVESRDHDRRDDDPRILAWRQMRDTTHAILARLDLLLQATVSITVSDYRALLLLWTGPPAGRRMVELARGTVLTPSAVTALVDRLERDGLVTRAPDPSDRRGKLVSLTAAGRARFAAAAAVNDQAIADLFSSNLTDAEAGALSGILSRIRIGGDA